jgi:hypothetical protein
LVLALLVAGASLEASLTLPIDFRTLVNDASLIVRGRVTDVRAIEAQGSIDSIATVAVESVVKGNASRFVYVRVPGGLVGSRRTVVVGAPRFRVGQRALLFLRPGATDTAYRPVGLTQGVYPILADPATGKVIVEPPVMATKATGASGAVVRGDKHRTPPTVPEFESFIRLAMATPPGAVTNRGKGGR